MLKKVKLVKVGFVGLVVFGLTLLSSTAFAQDADDETDDATASISIVEALQITENTALDFGSYVSPDDDVQITLDPDSGDVTVDGDDGVYSDGSSQVGLYDIEGSADATVNVQATVDNDFGEEFLSIDELTVDNEQPDLDDQGDHQARVGGSVDIGSDAQEGDYEADITVSVSYE